MQKNSRYIVLMGISIGCISSEYFLSLFFPVPFLVTILIVLTSMFFLYRWIMPGISNIDDNSKASRIPFVILVISIFAISFFMYDLANKRGGWDAWAMWNLDAKYLADPVNWQRLFLNKEYSHPDYPLCAPLTLGFFIRLFNNNLTPVIPFVFYLLITLCIPVIIYEELITKNKVVASLAVLLVALNIFYVQVAAYQYPDILLAFFFLCSLISASHIRDNSRYITLCVLFLGCCAWTKNEGIVLSIIFLLYYSPIFFSRTNIKNTLASLIIPVLIPVLFKFVSKSQSDLISESGSGTFGLLFQTDRYVTVYNSFIENVRIKFLFFTFGFYLFLAVSIIKKKVPDRQMWILLTCLIAYFMVYVLTPKPLEWHLHTSQDRLMVHLLPAFIYVMAKSISEINFSKPEPRKIPVKVPVKTPKKQKRP